MKIREKSEKLGVLIPGLGAIGTTFIAGLELIKKGYSKPIGSLTQMGTIRLGKRTDNRSPLLKDFLPLAKIEDLVISGWDIFEDSAYDSAKNAQVLSNEHIELVKDELKAVKPMKAVFDKKYVKKLDGTHIKQASTKLELAQMLMTDIKNFKKENELTDIIMVWCASTEIYIEEQTVHKSLSAFEKGMLENDEAISPSMIYAYAAL
ncbi:MAG: inositol-3-phosphate synthase, partial [Candidatus Cloacimonetes bacterium]|nr:inositol-3-phosphate synthase [Candidatus Cloacimonadota bacterium]